MIRIQLTCLLLCLFTLITFSQNVGQKGDSIVNYKDINGMKQGLWKKRYKNGQTTYIAHFKNDKFIGNYKRYYKNGKQSLEVDYDNKEAGPAKIFYDNGVLGSEGNYINRNVKDGLWKYYGVDGRLVVQAHYKNGIIHGQELKFWRNGKKMEEKNWIDGKQEGLWAQWFENGNSKLKTRMINDKRSGLYYAYYKTGKYYIKGRYKDNLRIGPWSYFDKDGAVTRATEYTNGKAADAAERDAKTAKEIKEWEEMKGMIPNPDIKNMFEYQRTYGPIGK